ALYILKRKKTSDQLIRRMCKRIDYFLWNNKFEYDQLNSQLGNILPPFMQATVSNRMENVVPCKEKSNSLLIGNSGSPYNNHLDAIEVLKKCNYRGNIWIPFSYGDKYKYNQKVKKAALYFGLRVNFIENFIPYEEYIYNINQHS